jgi:hypothetical protein
MSSNNTVMRLTFIKVFNYVSFTLKLIIVIVSFTLKLIIVIVIKGQGQGQGQGQGRNVMRQEYEGVEPYINDLQSKCIAVCNISLFFVAKALD